MNTYPNDATGDALKRMENDGSDLSMPMEFDFCIGLPSETAGTKMTKQIESLGFDVNVEKDDKTQEWTCYCTKTIIPTYDEVSGIEKQLSLVAKPYGGYSDGFGSYGNENPNEEKDKILNH